MWKTILRRVLLMLPQIFILSVLAFLIAKMMPGDPFTGLITPETDPNTIEALRVKSGFYDPLPVQYWNWISKAFRGDFGQSYTYKYEVTKLIGERIGNTVWLSLLTLILTYLIALPLGMIAGRYQNSWADKAIVVYTFITYSIPVFVFALVLLWLFGYTLGWFPTRGSVDSDVVSGTLAYYLNKFHHLILPAFTMAILSTTGTIQYLRTGVIDAKSQDYVRTARAKGVPENVVFNRHIFRNSILPIAAFLGYEFTGLIGGSVFIENIFSYPGMGNLFVSSITGRDYSVILALLLLFGTATLLGTLLSDIIMSIVDPRVRVQ
ncbi:Glutathione transport system permease protein GsiC [Granulicatella adiacens]|jgi:oligopeptide ABC superfamily ATP binding cassette transporter, permease protein|uniref:oligopeptide ABC transporter permease n=1 Tax=Granulicatella TaxID=117563 RepID=UPI0008A62565|nr:MULTISPECIES: oligopeptide ABC transporter permease [Granulicatella]MBF1210846.1 ABC transporter permease [Granulicatella sp.]MCT2159914.1 ABC transporter permease [Granulicatella adiacens]OFT01622.1 peptide ABC transporter permease [Granulicatella sp. HMSC31F03]OFT80143.1 peptide ABC transporter permease [Granulicatella sp. HMSC30F09]RKW26290.1 MAG: ABC transporter permease [Granulicatella sp.]